MALMSASLDPADLARASSSGINSERTACGVVMKNSRTQLACLIQPPPGVHRLWQGKMLSARASARIARLSRSHEKASPRRGIAWHPGLRAERTSHAPTQAARQVTRRWPADDVPFAAHLHPRERSRKSDSGALSEARKPRLAKKSASCRIVAHPPIAGSTHASVRRRTRRGIAGRSLQSAFGWFALLLGGLAHFFANVGTGPN